MRMSKSFLLLGTGLLEGKKKSRFWSIKKIGTYETILVSSIKIRYADAIFKIESEKVIYVCKISSCADTSVHAIIHISSYSCTLGFLLYRNCAHISTALNTHIYSRKCAHYFPTFQPSNFIFMFMGIFVNILSMKQWNKWHLKLNCKSKLKR